MKKVFASSLLLLLALVPSPLNAQVFTISGFIHDEDFGNPVPNVHVVLIGNNNYIATYTNDLGFYQFTNVDGGKRYTVSPNKHEYTPIIDNSTVDGAYIMAIATSELGNVDGEPAGRYHGHGSPWCSEFVSWVYWIAGDPFTGGIDDGGDCEEDWNMAAADRILAGFGRNEDWQFLSIDEIRNNWPGGAEDPLEPRPGDYVFFSNTSGIDRNHSGLVDQIVGSDMETIEGNWNDVVSAVTRSNWRTLNFGDTIVKGIGYRRIVSNISFEPRFYHFRLEGHQLLSFTKILNCKGDVHIAAPLTVAWGVNQTPSGGVLSIVQGDYPESLTLSKPMEIRACPGPVTIGAP